MATVTYHLKSGKEKTVDFNKELCDTFDSTDFATQVQNAYSVTAYVEMDTSGIRANIFDRKTASVNVPGIVSASLQIGNNLDRLSNSRKVTDLGGSKLILSHCKDLGIKKSGGIASIIQLGQAFLPITLNAALQLEEMDPSVLDNKAFHLIFEQSSNYKSWLTDFQNSIRKEGEEEKKIQKVDYHKLAVDGLKADTVSLSWSLWILKRGYDPDHYKICMKGMYLGQDAPLLLSQNNITALSKEQALTQVSKVGIREINILPSTLLYHLQILGAAHYDQIRGATAAAPSTQPGAEPSAPAAAPRRVPPSVPARNNAAAKNAPRTNPFSRSKQTTATSSDSPPETTGAEEKEEDEGNKDSDKK